MSVDGGEGKSQLKMRIGGRLVKRPIAHGFSGAAQDRSGLEDASIGRRLASRSLQGCERDRRRQLWV